MSSTPRADCLTIAANTADQLLSIAKQDQQGVFWDSFPRSMSTADNAAMELSLHTGTPGILVFLSEYFRQTQDSRVPEIISRSVAWTRSRAKQAPIRNGFYNGFPGAMYALATAERSLGVDPSAGGPDEWRGLLQAKRYDLPSLADGVAGTLVALEGLHDLGVADTPLDLAAEFLRILVSCTRLTSEGVYWGRHPASIRPCVGFYHGSAGVQYALARYASDDLSAGPAWLAAAARRQENAQFDAATGNWRDFINEERFRDAATCKRLRKAAEQADAKAFDLPGDAVNWAHGTGGVLLARHAWHDRIADIEVKQDSARATDRLVRSLPDAAKGGADFSLYSGWAGVGLAVAHASVSSRDQRHQEIVSAITSACVTHHRAENNPSPEGDGSFSPLSLLRGRTGTAYFLLKISAQDFSRSVLAPLGGEPTTRPLTLSRDGVVRCIATAWLPRTFPQLDASAAPFAPEQLTLKSFLKSAQLATHNTEEDRADIFSYEAAILRAEASQDCYNYLACKRSRFVAEVRNSPRFANDRNLLKQTVVLRSEVQLGRIEDPQATGAAGEHPGNGTKLVLLVPEFCGIVEHPVPPATYAVLSQLKHPLKVKALCQVIRAKYPSLSGKHGVEAAVLREVRNGLLAGALSVQESQPLHRVLDAVFRR